MSEAEFALDAMLFICCKGWRQDYGGYTSYITRGEDEEVGFVNENNTRTYFFTSWGKVSDVKVIGLKGWMDKRLKREKLVEGLNPMEVKKIWSKIS